MDRPPHRLFVGVPFLAGLGVEVLERYFWLLPGSFDTTPFVLWPQSRSSPAGGSLRFGNESSISGRSSVVQIPGGGIGTRLRSLDELASLSDLSRHEVEEHPDPRRMAQIRMGEEPEVGGEFGIGQA